MTGFLSILTKLFSFSGYDRPEIIHVRRLILNKLMAVLCILGLPGVFSGAIQAGKQGRWVFSLIYFAVYSGVVITAIFAKNISERIKSLIVIIFLYLIAVAILVRIGLSGIGLEVLILAGVLSAVLLGLRKGLFVIGFCIFTVICIAAGMLYGFIKIYPEHMLTSTSPTSWFTSITVFSLVSLVIVIAAHMFRVRLEESLDLTEKHAAELELSNMTLRKEVASRKEAEEALRESEERFRELAELLPEIVFETDLSGRVTYANRNAFEQFGYTQEEFDAGLYGLDFLSPEQKEKAILKINSLLEGGESGLEEYTMLRKDGSTFKGMFHLAVIVRKGKQEGFRGIIIDITQMKELEARLLHAQKMEAVGTLAGGIAHDFNNILQALIGYLELLSSDEGIDDSSRRHLLQMERVVDRASALVSYLLVFSRKLEPRLKKTDLNQIISQSVELIRRIIPKMIQIETVLGHDLKVVSADANQIEQVLLNLASNARDAMPDGGKLIIETANVRLEETDRNDIPEANSGFYVRLKVTDTGCGMDEHTLDHAFEPFFTTKEIGKGSGLGLSMVYGIVKAHNGFMTCDSTPGKGSTFNVFFPTFSGGATAESQKTPIEEKLPVCYETILLVDDEEDILLVTSSILEQTGYSVLKAKSGEEAIGLYKEKGRQIDLVILDLGMPGIGGYETLRALLALDPNVKVLVSSGYSAAGDAHDPLEMGAKGFIGKPYGIADLIQKIRHLTDTA